MAQVSDKTLAWLWSVLHNGYHDPRLTYSITARALSAYPTLSPRTEVYTYPDGSSALLLTVSGTLPVPFRGTTYRFPLKLWIPQPFPREAPIVYVNPGLDMVIRPGQHVGVDGMVYHPYLKDWGRMWERCSLDELLGFLRQAFEREPPVLSRAQQAQFQRPIGQTASPQQEQGGAPPPPPKQRVGSPAAVAGGGAVSGDVPPPRPPKPGEEGHGQRDVGSDGPPLPPLPRERQQRNEQYQSPLPQQNGYAALPRPSSRIMSSPQAYPDGRPPGPSLAPVPGQPYQPRQSQYERSPVSPVSPVAAYSELRETKYSKPAPLPPQTQAQQPQGPNYQHQHGPLSPPGPQYSQQAPLQQRQVQPSPQHYNPHPPPGPPRQPYQYPPHHQQPPPPQQPPKPQPPPDLLTSPFEVALPTPQSGQPPLPAPPIPPNPEKEHLLHALSQTLTTQAHNTINRNLSFLGPLQAQHAALLAAQSRLEGEVRQLSHLDAQIGSNEQILRASLAHCESIISSTSSRQPPNVDDLLIAPTVVGTQLWNACADVEALTRAMAVLQRGVDRGRVGGGAFVKSMRGLARERCLRMAVARKCARGLGLEVRGLGR